MAKHAEKERLERWRKSDFYSVLGIASSASTSEVKKAFRKVALTCHPDKVQPEDREEATRHFQLIAEAYEVLSKDASRRQYDGVRPVNGRPSNGTSYPTKAGSGGGGYAARYAEKAEAANAQRSKGAAAWGGFPPEHPFGPGPKDPFAGGWHQCDGCGNRDMLVDLRSCKKCPYPHSAGLLCKSCDMCAGCIPDDINSQFPPRYKAAQAPPRGNVPRETQKAPRAEPRKSEPQNAPRAEPRKSEQRNVPQPEEDFRKPAWNARPLHEDLTEFWERADSADNRNRASKPSAVPAHKGRAEDSRAAPVRVRATESARKGADDNLQRHQRAPTPEPPDVEEELDKRGILMAMGFDERRAKAALQRCSSVEAAVEYLMLQGEPGVYSDYIDPVVRPAAQGLYGAAERAGVAPAANQAASALHGVVQPAAQGIYGVAERASAGLYGAIIQPVAAKIYGESQNRPDASGSTPDDLSATLVSLGFTEKQAREAAGRCSSVEAAVEWITTHPEFGG